jgi:FdrA protein
VTPRPATRFTIFRNLYRDSVALMQLAASLRKLTGVTQASCMMATPANLAQLQHAELAFDAQADPSDLLVVVRGDADGCDQALERARAMLESPEDSGRSERSSFHVPMTSIAAAAEQSPDADLALISVPGDYAAAEACKALSLGLHVMLFSDNVPIAEEKAIKTLARERGLLVMGPDCGTAIVNGVPLGFANVVRRGDIGLVAASGTGLQEVTCRIHNLGGGVSQALGTGGRDLHEEIGGLSMLEGLRALAEDPGTRVIVLVSKPPAPAVAQRVLDFAASCGKPTVVHFLGETARMERLHDAKSLQHAADVAVALAQGRVPPASAAGSVDGVWLRQCLERSSSGQRYIRGLFTGGTFCYEAQLVFQAQRLAYRSNAPVHDADTLLDTVPGNTFIDLGDDEFTRGRPHPMIDPSLRNDLVRAAAEDNSTAAILFDVVLGYGAHADPAGELAEALRDAQDRARRHRRFLALVGHVCGTDADPQHKPAQIDKLRKAGVLIADSNVHAATLAAALARQLHDRQCL